MGKVRPPHLEEAALDLYEACKEFVRKVESQQARSASSYAQMKAAIARADGPDSQDEKVESKQVRRGSSYAQMKAAIAKADGPNNQGDDPEGLTAPPLASADRWGGALLTPGDRQGGRTPGRDVPRWVHCRAAMSVHR